MSSALLSTADSAYSARNWDEALDAYRKALEAEPTNDTACKRLADVYAIRGMFNSVINTYFQLIDILEANGNLDNALDVANWVMSLQPESDRARMKMILIYQKRGDLKEVVRQSRELARLYIELGQGDQSIALLQKAQQADPDNLDIGLELAEMYVSHGHIQDGANQYRKVANAFLDQQNVEKAAEAFRRMKVIVPDDPGVLLTLGNLYVDLGRYNEAEQEYRSILRHNLNHEEALLALGRVCQLKGQFRDAILAFNKILSINPHEVSAKEKLGELYQAQGLASESIKHYLSAAQSYLEIDERDKAVRLYQIVLGMDPSNPTACRELTNLGAPLIGIRNEELEPPRPAVVEPQVEAAAVSAPASSAAASHESNEAMSPAARVRNEGLRPRAEEEAKPSGRGGLLRPKEGGPGGAKPTTRSGLLSNKPALGGGKPTLGAGATRSGLMRPGPGGGGDKPMLIRGAKKEEEAVVEAPAPSAEPVPEPPPPLPVRGGLLAPESDPTPLAPPPTLEPPPSDTSWDVAGAGAGGTAAWAAGNALEAPPAADPWAAPSEGLAPWPADARGEVQTKEATIGELHTAHEAHQEALRQESWPPVSDPFTSVSPDPFGSSGGFSASPDPFAAVAADPFGGSADPFASQVAADPFAAQAPDPFASSAPDPFAVSAVADPFASATSSASPFGTTNVDPFGAAPDPFAASAHNDPFAATPSQEPFAIAAPDPFATTAIDPFGGSAEPFPAAPSAESHSFGASPDPFSTQAPGFGASAPAEAFASTGDPFGSPAPGGFAGQDPFGTSLEPFGAPGADPFSGATDPFGAPATSELFSGAAGEQSGAPAVSEPFGAPTAEFSGAASGSPDPFGAPDPFSGAAGDPFGGSTSDPFSTPAPVAPLDPFGADPGADPFGGTFDPSGAPAAASPDYFGAPAVNDPFVAPAPDPFASTGPASFANSVSVDPFGGSAPADPFASSVGADPFAGSAPADPFASSVGADPFGGSAPADPFASSVSGDPFASSVSADPFASSVSADPFASSVSADPFAGSAPADPFASSVSADPFAGSAPADPFASPVSADPFAGSAPADPFASSVSADPFASSVSADPFASSVSADPFASSVSADPFAGSAPADPFASPVSADPFAGSAPADPFASSVSADPFAGSAPADQFASLATTDPFAPAVPSAAPFGGPQATADPFGAAAPPFSTDPFAGPGDPFASVSTEPFPPSPLDTADPFGSFAPGPVADPFGAPTASPVSPAPEAFGQNPVADGSFPGSMDPFAAVDLSPAPAPPAAVDPFAPAPAGLDPFGATDMFAGAPAFASVTAPEPAASIFNPPAEASPFASAPAGVFGSTPEAAAKPESLADRIARLNREKEQEPAASAGLMTPAPEPESLFAGIPAPSPAELMAGFEASAVDAAPEPAPLPMLDTFETVPALEPTAAIEVPAAEFREPVAVEPEVVEPPAPPPAPEPEPPAPEPEILGRPRASLSIEDEAPPAHVKHARDVRERHDGADVATRIRAYRKAIEEAPDNLVLRTELADIHLSYGLLEDAVVQYRQIIKRNTQSVCLHHRLIQAHLWNDNYDEAANTLMELAVLHTERNELQDALDALQTVLSLEPHHFQARRALVDRFTGLNESKLAAHHLRQLAEAAVTKGSIEEAIVAFQQLMEISDDPSFQDRLAQVYESQGEIQLALDHYRSLVNRYRQSEQWEEAAATTERIVSLDPDNLETRVELIELYGRLGLQDKALEQRFGLALYHREKGGVQEATALFEQVLLEQPDHAEARRHLVEAYLDLQRIEEAQKQCDIITEQYLQQEEIGRPAPWLIALYQRLVENQPDNLDLRDKLIKFYNLAEDPENAMEQWLTLAQIHSRSERWDEAVSCYMKALELDENRVELHYSLARLYLEKLGNAAAAMASFQRVYELDCGHTEAMSKYVRMLLRMGKASGAAEVLDKLEKSSEDGAAVRQSILGDFRSRIEQEPADLRARFIYGELCYHLGELDLAIEQFQQTRRDSKHELKSYNMLGLCFAEKTGFNMLDLAIKQFRKGLETSGHSEQEYLELRYNLAMLQYRNNRLQEALQELKDCYAVDIAYKDVREWVRRIEAEIAGGPKVNRPPSKGG